jgi:site-specific DNA-methyltransferase (adenine-specific)
MPAAPVIPVHEGLVDALFPVAELRHYHLNARTHADAVLRESLLRNGQYKTLVVNRGSKTGRPNEVLAGNGTLAALRELGVEQAACEWLDVDDEAAARIVLVDNRSSDLAGYDDALLAELLAELPDLDGTGFLAEDRAALLAGFGPEPVALTDVDDAPSVPEAPVSRPGDVWLLGPHRLFVGQAEDAAGVALMLDGDQPDCVWTDPPYGVNYVGGTTEALTILNDDSAALPAMLLGAYETIAAVCRPGAPVYVAHADSERLIFEGAMRQAGLIFRQNLVWVKNALVMGRSDYHYRHEPVLEAEVPGDDLVTHDPVLYGFTAGGDGRLGRGGPHWHGDNKSSTVFEVPKPKRSGEHPTMKPVELIQAMLKNSLPPGGLVLDLFAGSGSTLITAHHMKARAAVVELDPRYVDVICRRWQQHTGVVPIRQSTGKPVDFADAA